MSRPLPATLLAATAACAILGLAAPALAQNITLGNNVTRSVSNRDDSKYPLWVSRADCESDDEFSFPLDITSVSGVQNVEVWIASGAADCSKWDGFRNPANGICQRIKQITPAVHVTATIKSKDIATGLDIANCEDTTGTTQAHKATITFLLLRDAAASADADPGDAVAWDKTSVDVLGPTPPTKLSAGVSDTRLHLSYDTHLDDQDTKGFYFYCDQGGVATTSAGAGGGGGAGGGAATGGGGGVGGASGAGGAGGAGGGAGGGEGCPPSVLVAGEPPPADKKCGGTTGAEGNTETGSLVNGVVAVVGVAGYDAVDNVGDLSELVCETPQPIDDFYKVYRRDGGTAGGGYCSAGGGASGAFAGLALAGAAAFVARRRRRA